MRSFKSWRVIVARLLIIVGVGMIAYYYGTGIYTFSEQKSLRRVWMENVPAKKSDLAKPAGSGPSLPRDVYGRLIIPKLGLDVIVLEGTDRVTLMKGPGHIIGTADPRKGGNTAISGHRTTFGAPFRHLDELEKGDEIKLETAGGKFVYKVDGSASVKPTDLAVIGQNYIDRLTLTTCDPPSSAVRRLAVWATRI